MDSWSREESQEWVQKHFDEDTARQCQAQKVDGATLITLATGSNVSVQQLAACGFEFVADQLKLKRMVAELVMPAPKQDLEPVKNEDNEAKGRKLTMKEIKGLTPEDHHIYKMMRKKVTGKVKLAFPGNDIPKLQNNPAMQAKIQSLVEEWSETCTCKFFGPKEIREHIKCCLNERRRRVAQGEDLEKSKAKRVKVEHDHDEQHNDDKLENNENQSTDGQIHGKITIDDEEKADDNQTDLEMKSIEARCITPSTKDKEADDGKAEMNEDKSSENSENEEANDDNTESNIGNSGRKIDDKETEDGKTEVDEDKGNEKLKTDDKEAKDEKRTSSEERKIARGKKEKRGKKKQEPKKKLWWKFLSESEEESSDEEDFLKELTSKCSETIVLVAFGAHFFKDISRQQLESAVKSLNIQENLKRAEKNEFIFPLAKALLTKGIIKIKKNAKMDNLCRDDLKKVKPF